MIRYAYLHGFGSSPQARKGTALHARFAERGLELELPDLNQPSFEGLTYSAMVEHVEGLITETPEDTWRLIGSSLGGYVTARVAERNVGRVDRVLLLCPGFDMMNRWPAMLGDDAMRLWKHNGAFFFQDATGEPRPVSWNLMDDARTHPPFPSPTCPVHLIHGTSDEVVPIESSRVYAQSRPNVTLQEVDDDHQLHASVDLIANAAFRFLVELNQTR